MSPLYGCACASNVQDSAKPVVAAINGSCLGGGLEVSIMEGQCG